MVFIMLNAPDFQISLHYKIQNTGKMKEVQYLSPHTPLRSSDDWRITSSGSIVFEKARVAGSEIPLSVYPLIESFP